MKTADTLIDQSLGLWWTETPTYQKHHVGCFGFPLSQKNIKEAEERLRQEGCSIAIGPMEGNTWRPHRAVIESDGSPPFLLEPSSPPETAQMLRNEGFRILAEYTSSLLDLTQPLSGLSRIERRMTSLKVRPLNLDDFENELREIYNLSIKAFRDNFLYTPINESEFIAQYQAFQSHLTPECAFLAEDQGTLVGFVFGYPDQDRFIVKTLAVLPKRAYAGLGTLLVKQIQKQARQAGFSHAIHALQREDNQSLRISHRFQATIFRRYALFAKEL